MDEEELYLSNLKLLIALACLIDEFKKKNYAENHYVIPAYTGSIGVLMIQRIRIQAIRFCMIFSKCRGDLFNVSG